MEPDWRALVGQLVAGKYDSPYDHWEETCHWCNADHPRHEPDCVWVKAVAALDVIDDMKITLSSFYDPPIQETVWQARHHIAKCRAMFGKDQLCKGCTERVAAIAALEGEK